MIPANTPLLYEVELIDIEDKIDVKQGFESIDLDGDNHITLEEVSNKNTPFPYKKTKKKNQVNQANKIKPSKKNSYWIKFDSCFFKDRKKLSKNRKKKVKMNLKKHPTIPLDPKEKIGSSQSFNY